jgi:hypothetical protein
VLASVNDAEVNAPVTPVMSGAGRRYKGDARERVLHTPGK